LGGGVPIGALLATEEVSRAFTPGSHSSTFGGNPMACAAGVAVMERLTEGRAFLKEVRDLGKYLIGRLEELQKETTLIKEVRGAGLLVAVDVTVPTMGIVEAAYQSGLLINRTSDSTLRIMPPLTVRRSEIDRMIGLLSKILEKNHAQA
jgi:acetylornithine/succinyldiaminopimelate/putrescine aminotransferase